ncbi:MAG: carboxypeptidase regulatory-like domain-containing protein [Flavobacteriales bacterium]|nr:carboxypeptidase regulatory-like domain-containing protein [Flavobacteriales bacterium]
MRFLVMLALLLQATVSAQVEKHHLHFIQGQVTGGFTGEPIPFMRISVAGSEVGPGMTDFDGFYLLRPNVPPGRYEVRFCAGGYVPRTGTIEVLSDRAAFHEVKLPTYPRGAFQHLWTITASADGRSGYLRRRSQPCSSANAPKPSCSLRTERFSGDARLGRPASR